MRHSHDLLETAKDLLATGEGGPRESNIRRAASTVYYALFDCLARTCADLLIGGPDDVERDKDAWVQAYRALEHGFAKKSFGNKVAMKRFPSPVRNFAKIFIEMQKKRHEADYDPAVPISESEVTRDIERVTTFIDEFSGVPATVRRAFAAHVLLKTRNKEPPPKTATKKTAAKTG